MNTATTLLADLHALRDLLAQGWCQGTYARDTFGNAVDCRSSRACAWCLLGGIEITIPFERFPQTEHAIRTEINGCIPLWQDKPKRTQAEVLAMLDRAIATTQAGSSPQEVHAT